MNEVEPTGVVDEEKEDLGPFFVMDLTNGAIEEYETKEVMKEVLAADQDTAVRVKSRPKSSHKRCCGRGYNGWVATVGAKVRLVHPCTCVFRGE